MAVDVAIFGGLVGPARAMAPDQMKMDFLLIVGTMFAPAGAAAYAAGLGVHALMSALFGVVLGCCSRLWGPVAWVQESPGAPSSGPATPSLSE